MYTKYFQTLCACALVVFSLAACDSVDTETSLSDATASDSEFVSDIATEAGLTTEQAAAFSQTLSAHTGDDGERDPGALWYAAAELQQNASEQQKNRLIRLGERSIGGVFAQRRGPRNGRPGGAIRRLLNDEGPLAETLNLTDEQKADLEALGEQLRADIDALRNDDSLTDEERREAGKALAEQLQADIDAILTDDQKAAIEAAKAEREVEREARQEARMAAMIDALGLTDEQVADLDALREAVRAEIEALVGEGERPEREDIEALVDGYKEDLASFLTDAQYETVLIHTALAKRASQVRGRRSGERGGEERGERRG